MEKIEIEITPMRKEDVEEAVEIEKAAYGEHHWSADSFQGELNNNLANYYCAWFKGQMVGYAGFWNILDEGHITTIATHPDFKRKKIAEALINKIIEECYEKMIKYITLEVRVSNEPAIKLYEKYGFKSLGKRKGYYQNNNEDALIMWTENIFWDNFKQEYEKKNCKLKEFVTVK